VHREAAFQEPTDLGQDSNRDEVGAAIALRHGGTGLMIRITAIKECEKP
jgi:hypothetical protein